MTNKTLAVLLTIAVASTLSGVVRAADNSAAPQMHNGFSNRPPGQAPMNSVMKPAVSPTADQIRTDNVIGADVKNANGRTVATITDIIIDRRLNIVAVAVIAPGGTKPFDNGQKSAVAWSSLVFEPRPTPHFLTKLDQQALAAGTALVQRAKANRDYIDAKNDLLSKEAIGRNGQRLGSISNLVLTLGSGRLDALVIDTGGFISLGGANNHAVAWDAADPQPSGNGGPVHVAVTKAQVDGAPVTATMAPAPIPPNPLDQNPQIRRDATGNISGSKIPAPQDRR